MCGKSSANKSIVTLCIFATSFVNSVGGEILVFVQPVFFFLKKNQEFNVVIGLLSRICVIFSIILASLYSADN